VEAVSPWCTAGARARGTERSAATSRERPKRRCARPPRVAPSQIDQRRDLEPTLEVAGALGRGDDGSAQLEIGDRDLEHRVELTEELQRAIDEAVKRLEVQEQRRLRK
jgi:hypothetical protein